MRIAVAGAGIAGLSSAIALAARSFSVEVFERAADLEEVGAGIQLSPNATSVLKRLGVLGDLAEALVEPRAIEILDARNGALLAKIPLGETARQRYGAPYCLIHRADLQAGLLAAARRSPAIGLRLGAEVGAPGASADGVMFTVAGEERRADVLVAADGLRSSIRTGHFGHPGAEPLGRTAWRATLSAQDIPNQIPRDVTRLWLGPGGHLVHYPVRGGKELNVVAIAGGESGAAPPKKPFSREARRLIDAVLRWTPWPLYGVDATRAWVRGRVALTGDAAHAMAPSAAQGGAQAIEDAWVLASALARWPDDPSAALRAYERARRPRVEKIAREALRNLAVYNLGGLPAAARNIVLGAMSPERLLSPLDWLYGWKAE
ncbi:MAG: FAD-dependent monooxygenase [Propylenella sp.]